MNSAMSTARLTINLHAIASNWRTLDAKTKVETGAVVKADGYGLGAGPVSAALAEEGVRKFFVAAAEEGAAVRDAVGPGPQIFVFSGFMEGDNGLHFANNLIPLLNSPEQFKHLQQAMPDLPFGIQLDSGMNRLGMEPAEWAALRAEALAANGGAGPDLIMSHLACADEPDHPANAMQLAAFRDMTDGIAAPRSFSATGGILLGPDFHFDLTRPGVGLYGGLPFADARPVVRLSLPVIQTRVTQLGEFVGYGASWTADQPRRVSTVAAGYADGIHRALSGKGVTLWAGDHPCPVVGRVSMDLITCDVTGLDQVPDALDLLNDAQRVDDLAGKIGTIGYEVLTSLGHRYARTYLPD